MEKDFFDGYSAEKGSFRAYLRACLDGFPANERKASKRLKPGGGAVLLALDFTTAEGEPRRIEIAQDDSPDGFFAREWTRGLFEIALMSLGKQCEAQGEQIHYGLFERYDLAEEDQRGTYASLAAGFGPTAGSVTNCLSLGTARVRPDCAGETARAYRERSGIPERRPFAV